MTNITYFHSVVRDAYTDSSSSQGDVTPQISQRQTGETSTQYPVPCAVKEDSCNGEPEISPNSISESSKFRRFTFKELSVATRYSLDYKCLTRRYISDRVFKGCVYRKTPLATKSWASIAIDVVLLARKEQMEDPTGWMAEVKYLAQLSHPNLVRLLGYCSYCKHQLLVYEGMPHNLKNYLSKGSINTLPWGIRMKAALGAAKGLAFLHRAQVIYGNFKTSNVHLDTNYNAKLSDFGLSKNHLTGDTSLAAPEYHTTGHLTAKSDVYSFGVLLLEILTGQLASEFEKSDLVGWALPYLKCDIWNVADKRMKAQYPLKSVEKVAKLILDCLVPDAHLRPNMKEVIKRLEHLQDSRYMKFTLRFRRHEKLVRELNYSPFSQDIDIETSEDDQDSECFDEEVVRESNYSQFPQDTSTEMKEEEKGSLYLKDEVQDMNDVATREQEQEEEAFSQSTPTSQSAPSYLIPTFPKVSIKLEGENYDQWHSELLPIIFGKDMLSVIDGTSSPPVETITVDNKIVPNPSFLEWKRKDQILLSWLHRTLSTPVFAQFSAYKTSSSTWEALHKAFTFQTHADSN